MNTADGKVELTANDINCEGELRVRAERDARGDGRVYRIAFAVSDGFGGPSSGRATAFVPRKKKKPAVDSAPLSYDSFSR